MIAAAKAGRAKVMPPPSRRSAASSPPRSSRSGPSRRLRPDRFRAESRIPRRAACWNASPHSIAPELIGDFLGSAMIKDALGRSRQVGRRDRPEVRLADLPAAARVRDEGDDHRDDGAERPAAGVDLHGQAAEEGGMGGAVRGPRPELVSAIEVDRPATPVLRRLAVSQTVDRAEVLAGLARSLIATEQSELLSRFLDHALAVPKKYPLTEVHIKALVSLRPWLKKNVKKPSAALAKWLDCGPRAARGPHGPRAPGTDRFPPGGPDHLHVRRLRRAEAVPRRPARIGASLQGRARSAASTCIPRSTCTRST